MPLITTSHDSLPYIDSEPTPSERAAALSLIGTLLPSPLPQTHPLLPPLPPPSSNTLLLAEQARITAKLPLIGIDLSRYESLPDVLPASTNTNTNTNTDTAETIYQRAITAATYLRLRQERLAALEKEGKSDWLKHNEGLVRVLTGMEGEVEGCKGKIERLAWERRGEQEGVGGQMRGLEEGWRRGVRRVVETEIAAEGVRGEVLAARRAGR